MISEGAITGAIAEIKTELDGTVGLGKIYDHIPAMPDFPCVIITSNAPDLISEGETFLDQVLNLDIWVVTAPGLDNKEMQHSLFSKIEKTLIALDANIFESVSQPLPVEYNQKRSLAAIIAVNINL